jgi:hypothetical protein
MCTVSVTVSGNDDHQWANDKSYTGQCHKKMNDGDDDDDHDVSLVTLFHHLHECTPGNHMQFETTGCGTTL